ncbi:MAG: acetyltransferase [Phycisphaerae bacterium]|jgi:sugar O-acyltransferase (sialic acid O-acetyltransferase NeuD family)
MKRKILLIGAGGHCKVILDLLAQAGNYGVAGIIDLRERLGSKVLGAPVIGTDADLPRFFKSGIKYCFISVGSIGNPCLRIKLYNSAKKSGFLFPNLISADAKVSSQVSLGEGNYIAPGVIVNAGTQIGNNCIFNTGVIIEHDCRIGDFVHLSPGSILSGGVNIGEGSHIGSGSVIIQNIQIGERTVIGAGSVVTKNIRKGMVAYGNPCKERKTNA